MVQQPWIRPTKGETMSERAVKEAKRINPLMCLPAMAKLRALPADVRALIADLCGEFKQQAEALAQLNWRRRKGPLSGYWLAAGVYAAHTGRGVRNGLPRGQRAAGLSYLLPNGVHAYMEVAASRLAPTSWAWLGGEEPAKGGLAVVLFDGGAFVAVPKLAGLMPMPVDLMAVLDEAESRGARMVRLGGDSTRSDRG